MKHGIFLKISSLALSIAMALGVGVVAANMDIEPVKAADAYEKATSIAAGDTVVLVCETKKMELSSISTTSTKYGIGVAYSSTPAGVYELTVEEGSSSGTYSFKNGSNYLNWTSSNSLNTNSSKTANTSWKVTFSDGDATIANGKDNSRTIRWNASSPRFACYASGQTAVQLYKKVTSVSDEPAATLSSIAVTTPPTKTNYIEGETFNPAGMVVTATYNDDTTKDLEASDYTYEPSGALTTSDTEITVSYEDKTAKTEITVNSLPEGYVVDELTRETTGITDTTYSSWSGKTVTSAAVYAGHSAGGNESIQLRSNDNSSGIVTTASGGKVKKVTVTWQANTSSGRTLNVYGKNAPYSAATELYNTSTQGTSLGTIVCGTSTDLTINGEYSYIGLRSASGAMYLSQIKITWDTTGGSTATELTGLEFDGESEYKSQYFDGDNFDPTGLTINAKYGDYASDVTEEIVWPSTPLTAGTTSITISYTHDEVTEECNIPVEVIEKLNPIDVESEGETTADLLFDSTDNRTSYFTSKQVWSQNGITLTNNKGSSTTNVGDYSNPARFYKSSEIIISSETSFNKIDLNSDSSDSKYLTALEGSLSDFTTEKSENIITVTFSEAITEFTFTCSGGQVRLNSLTVYGSGSTTTHYANVNFNAQKAVLEFVNFMNKTLDEGVCKVEEYNLSSDDFATAWASISAKYENLFSGEFEDVVFAKEMITHADAVKDGDPLQHALYRYEKIVSEGSGIAHITAFMSGTRQLARNNFLGISNNETSVMLIVVMSSISLLSFSCFLFLRKRKEQQ